MADASGSTFAIFTDALHPTLKHLRSRGRQQPLINGDQRFCEFDAVADENARDKSSRQLGQDNFAPFAGDSGQLVSVADFNSSENFASSASTCEADAYTFTLAPVKITGGFTGAWKLSRDESPSA